ncbi:MAG: hypothetical protein AB198_00585 [Parcubacteria bacterium C7867-003]|nr:MAG: hypothetical protein AB198_00585 [Parcubacteria bacterium C7867-003]
MLEKIKSFGVEKIIILLICLSFFIGTWHALPMLNVVGDEMYYVGGVLRAIENHTVIPFPDDVPYGTLTYLVSFVVSTFSIAGLLTFFSFDVAALKVFLIQSPSIMYFLLRLTSACLSVVMLVFVNKILKREFQDFKIRVFLLVLLFTNIIVTTILHTGKMWVLSTLLVLISFFYLYKSTENNVLTEVDTDLNKNIFKSIIFSFLALSNFPLNLYSLICVPILLFWFKGDKKIIKKILVYTFVGAVIYGLVTLFNFEGIKNQIISIFVVYHPIVGDISSNLNFLASLRVYLIKLVILFPVVITLLFVSIKDGVRNKNLFIISFIYFLVYFGLIVVVANWTSDVRSYLRYLFPLGFFLVFIAASFNLKFKRIFYIFAFISVYFGVHTIYLLSVPTTYNKAYDWVNTNLSFQNVIIVNEISYLQLVKNKQSSLYTKESFCSTKCKNIISSDLNSDFKPLVIDPISKEFDFSRRKEDVYYIKETPVEDNSLKLVASFVNTGDVYHSVDYNLGSYFDLDYLRLKNLGKNHYIYKKSL